ncbi:MAG: hypothetical protein ACLU4P_03095 [Ruminococcus sp.]
MRLDNPYIEAADGVMPQAEAENTVKIATKCGIYLQKKILV